jgi:hypothetical protein
MAQLRDADELILPAVKEAIAALAATTDADAAVIRVAERYAAVIDDAADKKLQAWAMRNIGPLLLDALAALGATPAARAAITRGGKQASAPQESQLDRLRKAKARGSA